VIIPNQVQYRMAAEARAVAEAKVAVEAKQAVGAHRSEVEGWSIRRQVAEAVAEEDVVAAEEMVVDDPHPLQFIKDRGFLLDTFLRI
jgi:hypothetical protein